MEPAARRDPASMQAEEEYPGRHRRQAARFVPCGLPPETVEKVLLTFSEDVGRGGRTTPGLASPGIYPVPRE
jgi:hypothetical protein